MELVLPALGLTADVQGVIRGINYANYIGKKSYEVVKSMTGGRTGTYELNQGIVKKGLTGSGVAPLVGSNKVIVGSAKNLPKNNPMQVTPPRTPANKKRKSNISPSKISKIRRTKKKGKPFSTKATQTVAKAVSKIVKGVSEGKFKGRLTARKKEKFAINKFGKLGYTCSNNLVGTVADPNAVYIYHSTYDVNMIARAIIGALLRKLFKKAGIDVSNENNELHFRDFVDSQDFQIIYRDQDLVNGNSSPYDYVIPNNTTFKTLLDTFCVYTPNTPFKRIIDFMLAGADTNDIRRQPSSLCLMVRDKWLNGAVEEYAWRTHTHMDLQNEKIVFHSRSSLIVQNRTKGSAAPVTDYSDQRVDNQPLMGKLYEFYNGDPRLKTAQLTGTGVANEYDFLIGTAATPSVRAFGSTVFPSDYMDEVPSGKLWKNTKKTSNVMIQPGDIKKSTLDVTYDLPLLELLIKFRVVTQGTVSGTTAYTGLKSHQSEILALQEVLRTPADNFITVQYEVNNICGAYCYSKKSKSFFRTQNFEGTITQWVPPA